MELVTERLILREMVAEDWRAVLEVERDPAVVRYLTQEPATETSARAYVDRIIAAAREEPRTTFDFAITERGGDGRLLGRCGLGRKASEPRIAAVWYVLSSTCRRRGYATEAAREVLRFAFEDLALHRVYGDVDPRNPDSARVLERLGMRREAHHVDDVWIKGEWCSTWIYALLADEWRKRSETTPQQKAR